jgi:ornithine carbamoyltransferase
MLIAPALPVSTPRRLLGIDDLATDDFDALLDLASYRDAIAVRTDRHRDLLELAEHASVPVVNALTDREYPCRALADCLTLRDRFGELAGLEIAYVGASEPVTHSLIEAALLSGITVRVAAPAALGPDPALLARAGSSVRVCETPREAVSGAVAVYAAAARRELPDTYTVTPSLMSLAAPGAVVMHAAATAREYALNLLGVEQAVLRALVTGDWEA